MNQDLLNELRDGLPSLLDHYEPNPNNSDYRCVFCGNHAKTNNDLVVHRLDCLGAKLDMALNPIDI